MVPSCYQDGVQKDEDLFPAISNENNPVLKNKKVSKIRAYQHFFVIAVLVIKSKK